MLRVWLASGQQLAAVPVEKVQNVLSLKQHLQGICGLPRFRQRLLGDGISLADDVELESPMDLQLVLLHFSCASLEQADELQSAAKHNFVSKVEEVLYRPQDPDLRGIAGESALYIASERGHLEVVRLLLEAGASKDVICGRWTRLTPLGVASREGHREVVMLLLAGGSGGVDRERRDRGDREASPLYLASLRGHADVVRLLLQAGADKDEAFVFTYFQCDPDQLVCSEVTSTQTPLGVASREGHTEIAHLLLAAGADRNTGAGRHDETPLYLASEQGHIEIVRLLVMAGAAKDKCSGPWGKTPIRIACSRGHVEIVRLLLRAGANIDDCSLEDVFTSDKEEDIRRLLIDAKKATVSSGKNVATNF
ncbi:ANK1 [Symbiodinium natans]|uniref:ANK1 protein n=1 Tax=Symbiodinium natans TaxID=878477 RepID=A0A812SGH4_9DINO|nr:ANK1 [Symbiodinium natans]